MATKYDLEKYVKLRTTVESATWDEDASHWKIKLLDADGKPFNDYADVLFNCSGVLNTWKYPNIEGINQFKGKLMHSARWDGDYDLTGKRVAVIGGGSSAVQIIPSIVS